MYKVREIRKYRNYNYIAESESSSICSYRLYLEMRAWLHENQIRHLPHSAADIWYFVTQEDAMWFVLRWS